MFIRQRNSMDCGVAALAMLCKVDYETADRAIPWRHEGCLNGTTTSMLKVGGAKLGYVTKGTPQDRLKPLRGKDWKDIPDNSLVKIPNPNQNGSWHWVVWRKGKIYDPARGVFKPKNYEYVPTSYMHFMRDIEDICPKCGEPLTVKWSGVECPRGDYIFCH